jgi:gamma-glutamyl-gamma-aminobutyrate hydrolase PuuD
MMKPRIGITSGQRRPAWGPGGNSWQPYADAVERAGGEAVHLSPATLGREAEVLAGLEGILLPGGMDIDLAMYPNPPELHGENPAAVMARHHMRPEPDRDAYELPLLAEALARDLPLLGICRGVQVLNVGLGGRLILDIPTEVRTQLQHQSHPEPGALPGWHTLSIQPGTLLADLFHPGTHRECNSRHHQAVRVDEAFTARVAAVSPEDGVVEAIEVPGRRWALGVQWHPEHRTDPGIREHYEPLFVAFVQAASG